MIRPIRVLNQHWNLITTEFLNSKWRSGQTIAHNTRYFVWAHACNKHLKFELYHEGLAFFVSVCSSLSKIKCIHTLQWVLEVILGMLAVHWLESLIGRAIGGMEFVQSSKVVHLSVGLDRLFFFSFLPIILFFNSQTFCLLFLLKVFFTSIILNLVGKVLTFNDD